jgi:hypothetical protein
VYVVSSREIRYIQLFVGKPFFGCNAGFSTANLPKLLRAVVGADVSSYRACGDRPRGIGGTWKQAITQLLLRKVLPAKYQKI